MTDWCTARAISDPAAVGSRVVCGDARMAELWKSLERIAETDSTVLVNGPTGTGKELVARTIHRLSPRRCESFAAVNCGGIPRELIESELFGHERGAFTGAIARRVGHFEHAHRGTLFLDEISALSIDLQATLLRALQEREITRVGGVGSIAVDVRVIAATNVPLPELIARRRFRADLFYRLNVVPITLPPLRQRPDDIVPIAHALLAEAAARLGRAGLRFTAAAESTLHSYPWPGNVRELQNTVERAVVFADRDVIDWCDLPDEVCTPPCVEPERARAGGLLRDARDDFERWLICQTMQESKWRRKVAAVQLGVHRNTLLQMMTNLGISHCGGRCCPLAASVPEEEVES